MCLLSFDLHYDYGLPNLLEKLAFAALTSEDEQIEVLWVMATSHPQFDSAEWREQAQALFEVASLYITGDDNPFDYEEKRDRRQKVYEILYQRLKRRRPIPRPGENPMNGGDHLLRRLKP